MKETGNLPIKEEKLFAVAILLALVLILGGYGLTGYLFTKFGTNKPNIQNANFKR